MDKQTRFTTQDEPYFHDRPNVNRLGEGFCLISKTCHRTSPETRSGDKVRIRGGMYNSGAVLEIDVTYIYENTHRSQSASISLSKDQLKHLASEIVRISENREHTD